MSLQIVKKYIGADAVDGSKIKLLNNQALRARNAADSADIDVLKLNTSNDLVLDGSDIDMSAAIVKNIGEARATQLKIGSSALVISEGSIPGQGTGGIDSYTTLMLHLDGDVTDSAPIPNTPTTANRPTYETGHFGQAGVFALDNLGNGINTLSYDTNLGNLGADDFTIDFWMKTSNVATQGALLNTNPNWGFFIQLYYGGIHFAGRNMPDFSGGSMSNDTWHHVAIVRNGTSMVIYIDGTSVASGSAGAASIYPASKFEIGEFNGLLDEFRISKGIARWTSNFTPPASPYSTGGTPTPALSAGSVEVVCSAAPTTNNSLTNKEYVDAQIAAAQVASANFVQYSYTLQAGDISNGYVDLQDTIVHESLVASLDRQMLMGHNVDYTIADTGVDGVSRITFANDIASSGNLAAVAGDIMYFMYLVA